jgi:hypothetical protein
MMMWLKSEGEVADRQSTLRASIAKARLRWSVRGISAVLRIGKFLIRLDKQRGDLLEGAGEAPFEQGM